MTKKAPELKKPGATRNGPRKAALLPERVTAKQFFPSRKEGEGNRKGATMRKKSYPQEEATYKNSAKRKQSFPQLVQDIFTLQRREVGLGGGKKKGRPRTQRLPREGPHPYLLLGEFRGEEIRFKGEKKPSWEIRECTLLGGDEISRAPPYNQGGSPVPQEQRGWKSSKGLTGGFQKAPPTVHLYPPPSLL